MAKRTQTFEKTLVLDMPAELAVTDDELALIETYLRDIIAQMLADELKH